MYLKFDLIKKYFIAFNKMDNQTKIQLKASLTSSILTSIICAPLDRLQTLLQINNHNSNFKAIYQTEGIRGFYRGLHCQMAITTGFYGSFFPLYNLFKSRLLTTQLIKNDPLASAVSGIVAGSIGGTLASPFCVIKVRQQAQPNQRLVPLFKQIYHNEGFLGYYKGLSMTFLKCFEFELQIPLYEYF